MGSLRTIANFKRIRSRRHVKKNKYKKALHRSILDNHDNSLMIHNLSKFDLKQPHINVLSKGLSFVPTPKPTLLDDIYSAFYKFRRRLYLRFLFLNKPQLAHHPFHLASTWEPPTPHNNSIEQYVSHVYREISYLRYPYAPANNLSLMELVAMHDLKSNTNIIIKPADKGGKIVLLDKSSYLQEAYRQLNDPTYYTPVQHDPIGDLALEISSFISFLYHKKYITYQIFKFLDPKGTTRTPIFYLLPKIHKPGTPGRPIISGYNSPTANLSTYVDFYLKPIVKQLPSYIQDTTHFLRTLRGFAGKIPQNSFLVTFDVKSLYTNIPHDEGIACCSTALQEFYGQSLPLPLKYMLQFIVFILKKNYFKFRDTFYLQIHGTAMGSPFAPNYANIFMDYIERRILDSAPDNKKPILWLRFIDDIFAIWTYDHYSLHQFFEHMNIIHPTIKFEMSQSRDRIPFLDTLVLLNNRGDLQTTLYKKPTDASPLLHAASFHPSSCKTGVIYSQALRYRRIISNDDDFAHHLENLQTILIKRGYNIGLISDIFAKVRSLSRNDLLQYHDNPPTIKLPFVIPYNSNTSHIGKTLHSHWYLIQEDDELQDLSSIIPVMAFQRNRNTKDTLVHSNMTD